MQKGNWLRRESPFTFRPDCRCRVKVRPLFSLSSNRHKLKVLVSHFGEHNGRVSEDKLEDVLDIELLFAPGEEGGRSVSIAHYHTKRP